MLSRTDKFRGLNNVSETTRLGNAWLKTANNVHVNDRSAIERRSGYTLSRSGSITGAYSTLDFGRMFIVDGGELKQVNEDMSVVTLRTGITSAPMYWAEVNGEIYYSNGASKGIIGVNNAVRDWSWSVPDTPRVSATGGSMDPGNYRVACTFVLPDGRETGSSDFASVHLPDGGGLSITNIPQGGGVTNVYVSPADSSVFQYAFSTTATSGSWNASLNNLGQEMVTYLMSPPPETAVHVAYWQGRMYLMEYQVSSDTTTIWFSEPFGFHLFNQEASFIQVRQKGQFLAASAKGLIIGTNCAVYVYDGKSIEQVANYGVPPGWPSAMDDSDGSIYFWTYRGLCQGAPFSNLTERMISVNHGDQASVAVVQTEGGKRIVTTLKAGGEAFNPR